jgi:ubiquinone/menaquinone biosynthesis C-methylase UbiE
VFFSHKPSSVIKVSAAIRRVGFKLPFVRKMRAWYRAYTMLSLLDESGAVSAIEAREFNHRSRDRWVEDRARSVKSGLRVLDVGAGTAPYRKLFEHCQYETQDFAQYDGYKGPEGQYSKIDYVSDITEIPVDDATFDVILCTEVLEHVPRPVEALREMVRITKPGGRLFLTAPLGSGIHQEPYHFYGGYSDYWYRKFLTEFGCEVVSIEPNHGFFAHLGQECARFAWQFEELKLALSGFEKELIQLTGDILPRYFHQLDKKIPLREFTIGFHVEARRDDRSTETETTPRSHG